jgi:hypothetical protein
VQRASQSRSIALSILVVVVVFVIVIFLKPIWLLRAYTQIPWFIVTFASKGCERAPNNRECCPLVGVKHGRYQPRTLDTPRAVSNFQLTPHNGS